MAKNIPNPSTLRLRTNPGKTENKLHSIVLPDKITGIMETMIKNLVIEAKIVQNSLKLGFCLEKYIKKTDTVDIIIAKKGKYELTTNGSLP